MTKEEWDKIKGLETWWNQSPGIQKAKVDNTHVFLADGSFIHIDDLRALIKLSEAYGKLTTPNQKEV
jgi:hypothetical protein